jgi:hypothetical protein
MPGWAAPPPGRAVRKWEAYWGETGAEGSPDSDSDGSFDCEQDVWAKAAGWRAV